MIPTKPKVYYKNDPAGYLSTNGSLVAVSRHQAIWRFGWSARGLFHQATGVNSEGVFTYVRALMNGRILGIHYSPCNQLTADIIKYFPPSFQFVFNIDDETPDYFSLREVEVCKLELITLMAGILNHVGNETVKNVSNLAWAAAKREKTLVDFLRSKNTEIPQIIFEVSPLLQEFFGMFSGNKTTCPS